MRSPCYVGPLVAAMLAACATATAAEVHSFDIPSQSLTDALNLYARQAGVQIANSAVDQVRAPAQVRLQPARGVGVVGGAHSASVRRRDSRERAVEVPDSARPDINERVG